MTAITALTAQNTRGVQGVFDVPADFIRMQIDSVMADIGADAWKTGMLSTQATIAVVAERARHYAIERLVVDPVMVAKGGDPLLQPSARDALIEQLLPLAYVVTPNHHEAQVLTGLEIHTVEDMCRAAQAIYAMGPKHVVVKGGHLPVVEAAIDVLYDGTAIETLEAPRVDTKNTHGTGCTYASSIAAELTKGHPVYEAVRIAKAYLTAAIQAADEMDVGHGHGPLNHFLGREIEVL
jgi:hydroxymethylpyrimidine/phosphomethylpyrimidine kinase